MTEDFKREEDLRWQACRYLLDELEAQDAADFERRLEEDQGVRDALLAAGDLQAFTTASLSPRPQPAAHVRKS